MSLTDVVQALHQLHIGGRGGISKSEMAAAAKGTEVF
jgi:hypothetical protein